MNLGNNPLILPRNFVAKRKKIIGWFKETDRKLASGVLNKVLNLNMARTYFQTKVETCPDLSRDDKQMLATESLVWKIPEGNGK